MPGFLPQVALNDVHEYLHGCGREKAGRGRQRGNDRGIASAIALIAVVS